MNRPPRVSVLVTAHNRAGFLVECLESVLASTFTDYELLVVDDASTDESVTVARQFEQRDERVRVIVNERNLGQFANRNHAASLAQGELLKYLDSDDVLYPHGLEAMVRFLDSEPEAGAAISHDMLHEDRPYPIVLSPAEGYRCFFLGRGFPNSGPSAAIIRRTAFESVGGFPEPHYVGTDTIFWLRLAARFPIVKMPPALNWYRRHGDQAFTRGIQGWEYLAESLRRQSGLLQVEECPLTVDERSAARRELERRTVRALLRAVVRNRAPLRGLRAWRQCGLSPLAIRHVLRHGVGRPEK